MPLEPAAPRYSYVYAVALDQAGRRADALKVLDDVLQRHPYNTEALSAGAAWAMQRGDTQAALGYLMTLHALRPNDREIDQEIEQLRRTPPRR